MAKLDVGENANDFAPLPVTGALAYLLDRAYRSTSFHNNKG